MSSFRIRQDIKFAKGIAKGRRHLLQVSNKEKYLEDNFSAHVGNIVILELCSPEELPMMKETSAGKRNKKNIKA